MNATMLSLPRPFGTQISFASQHHHHAQFLLLAPLKSSSSSSNETSNGGENTSPPPPPPVTAPNTVEIRFRRGSRRRRRNPELDGTADGQPMKTQPKAPKDWESMTLTEKAMQLYMGEKGLLFWLNKFAYASIFIIIGGWILFRFVGPALNLYQFESPPLAPTSMFTGS